MIRIGIIGTDIVAHIHASGLLTNNNYEISGCYAPDNSKSMVFARQYRLVSYSSIEALFKYTDAVDITDDFPEIMDLAEKSLKRLKHVNIAQPHLLTLNEIRYLVKLADESGVVLQLGAGYRYCSAYEELIKLEQRPRMIGIRHRLSSENIPSRIYRELSRDLDFVLGILHANICKVDVKTWAKREGSFDLFNCRLECDNGCSVSFMVNTLLEGDSNLEMTFDFSDMIVRANVFKSVIEKKYCNYDVIDSIVLDAFNEKTIHKQDLRNFYKAIQNDPEAIRRIDEQLQSIYTADYIIERINQLRPVTFVK